MDDSFQSAPSPTESNDQNFSDILNLGSTADFRSDSTKFKKNSRGTKSLHKVKKVRKAKSAEKSSSPRKPKTVSKKRQDSPKAKKNAVQSKSESMPDPTTSRSLKELEKNAETLTNMGEKPVFITVPVGPQFNADINNLNPVNSFNIVETYAIF